MKAKSCYKPSSRDIKICLELASKYFEVDLFEKQSLSQQFEIASLIEFNLFVSEKTYTCYYDSLYNHYSKEIKTYLDT
jgi:hypothetical protein